ncbi:MAG TPA: alpha/beta hydrolase [Caulobacteraceae bacterium]|nr:alpha/beta hydrolase [Caulobacteraceae bacterium]
MKVREAIGLQGLAAARALIRRLHLRNLDRGAQQLAASTDLEIEGAEGPLPARLYVPALEAGGGSHPLLVYFHGGGFVLCDIDSHDALCRRLAAASGMRVLSVGYRLAPEHRFPAMHRDAAAAWTWARRHAGELGADPERIGLGGDSAGGHMAAWLALRGEARPAFLALFYPLLDVGEDEWLGSPLKDLRFLGRAAVGYIRRQIEDFEAEGGLNDFRLAGRDLSGLPPTVLVETGLDPLKPGIRAFADDLRQAGVRVEHLSFPMLAHGAFNFAYVSHGAAQALENAGEALRCVVES